MSRTTATVVTTVGMRVNLLEFIGRNFFLFNTSLHSNTRWSRLSSQEVSSCIRILKWWDQIKLTEFQYLCRCDQPILVIQPWDATDAQIREVSGQITNRHWDRQTPVVQWDTQDLRYRIIRGVQRVPISTYELTKLLLRRMSNCGLNWIGR